MKKKTMQTYKNYVCPKCFNILTQCNCDKLSDKLIYIDVGIQEHIKILNAKGYKTLFCCESHYERNDLQLYISFAYQHYHLGELPHGFKRSADGRNIEYIFNSKLSRDAYSQCKNDVLKELLEWCKALPNL